MNTPPHEFLDNELIKEFADRCQSASRSIQGYMVSENPAPDNETMESLIDTNEFLQSALNQHKRAILNARKHMGLGGRTDSGTSIPVSPPTNGTHDRVLRWQESQAAWSPTDSDGPPLPDRPSPDNDKGKGAERFQPPPGPPPGHGPSSAGPSGLGISEFSQTQPSPVEDPFRDPQPAGSSSRPGPSYSGDYSNQRLAEEPFHPGFQPTPSYIGRQESAVGKLTMHGADASTPTGPAPSHRRVSEISDDDLYDASPRTQEPMYRY